VKDQMVGIEDKKNKDGWLQREWVDDIIELF